LLAHLKSERNRKDLPLIQLTKSEYTSNEVAKLLGVSMNRLWRLKRQLGIRTRTRGADRRIRWMTAGSVRTLHRYLRTIQEDTVLFGG